MWQKSSTFIIVAVIISCGLIYYQLRNSGITQQYNPLDSRSRMTQEDLLRTDQLESGAFPVSATAVTNLKKNIPITTTHFNISWNSTTNQADVELYSPYKVSTSELLTWLGEHQANSLPSNTLNIIKR